MNDPPPSRDRWREVESLFHEALALDPAAQREFLDRRCADDSQLRREVERLIRHDGHGDDLLASGAWKDAVSRVAESVVDGEADPLAQPGAPIGRYRLVAPIAAGGMGTVWRAERTDGQFVQSVAVKLIKRGMDTDDLLLRFRNERQVLANLDHPNIARLLDGGATEDGRPFLVMEHIEGVPIDRYCIDHALDIRQRLRLFQRVCSAVHEAHKNLIIHRDLKPGNILVTADGEPKLLDFGIAKLLEPTGAGSPSITANGMRLLTPRYASPEQVRGGPITTASDVYSLGVLLYELLTGRSPYAPATASRRELEAAILETTPLRPSLAVTRNWGSTADSGAPADPHARRPPTRSQLRRVLRGDLDTIVLKALAKSPADRYESVAALVDDLERHLNAQPITAAAEPLTTLVRKFVRRHRGTVITATIVAAVIVGAGAIATWLAVRETQAREVAESINRFLRDDLFGAANPTMVEQSGLTVRQALDRASERLEVRFRDQPHIEAALRQTIGETYLALGLPKAAIPHLERAVELNRTTQGARHSDTRRAMRELASALYWNDQGAEARALADELLDLDVRAAGRQSADVMATRHLLALTRDWPVLDERLAELHEILAWNAAHLGESDSETLAVMHTLANEYIYNRRYGEAEPLVERIWTATQRVYGPAHPETLEAMVGRALVRGRTDRGDEAIEILEEAVRIHRETKPDDFTQMGITLVHLGNHLEGTGRLRDAEAAYLEAYDILSRSLGPEIGWTRGIIPFLVKVYERLDQPDKAAEWKAKLGDSGGPHNPNR
jgi:serine/threonine-protein kinase